MFEVQTINVSTYECRYEAVPVNFLRIQDYQGRVLDCPFMPMDDVEALVKRVNELLRQKNS